MIDEWRLRSVGLLGPQEKDPVAVLRSFGAMQSQEHGPALWGLSQRTGRTQAELSAAFDRGDFLRTHVLRPTWHYVLPEDLPWLLELTAERVHGKNGTYYRQLGLEPDVRARYTRAIAAALAGGPQPRAELVKVLEGEGMQPDGIRLAHALMAAELEGAMVSGPMAGKQHTYAAFGDRVPSRPSRDRDEALADLAARYVARHAPVGVKDFAWWSGLTVKDATRGLEAAGAEPRIVDGVSLWSVGPSPRAGRVSQRVHLIQAFDEYVVGYAGKAGVADQAGLQSVGRRFSSLVLADGLVAGGWKRVDRRGSVTLEVSLTPSFPDDALPELDAQADRFARFTGRPTTLSRAG